MVKQTQNIQQQERAQKFMKDRIDRLKKREQNKQQFLKKNRQNAINIKKNLYKGIENSKKQEQLKIAKIKAKKIKDQFEKSILGVISPRNNIQEGIKEKLEKEQEESQANVELLKELKTKELKLLARLQATIDTSMDFIEHAKKTQLVSSPHGNFSKTTKSCKKLEIVCE